MAVFGSVYMCCWFQGFIFYSFHSGHPCLHVELKLAGNTFTGLNFAFACYYACVCIPKLHHHINVFTNYCVHVGLHVKCVYCQFVF